jgi:hypothetical protein
MGEPPSWCRWADTLSGCSRQGAYRPGSSSSDTSVPKACSPRRHRCAATHLTPRSPAPAAPPPLPTLQSMPSSMALPAGSGGSHVWLVSRACRRAGRTGKQLQVLAQRRAKGSPGPALARSRSRCGRGAGWMGAAAAGPDAAACVAARLLPGLRQLWLQLGLRPRACELHLAQPLEGGGPGDCGEVPGLGRHQGQAAGRQQAVHGVGAQVLQQVAHQAPGRPAGPGCCCWLPVERPWARRAAAGRAAGAGPRGGGQQHPRQCVRRHVVHVLRMPGHEGGRSGEAASPVGLAGLAGLGHSRAWGAQQGGAAGRASAGAPAGAGATQLLPAPRGCAGSEAHPEARPRVAQQARAHALQPLVLQQQDAVRHLRAGGSRRGVAVLRGPRRLGQLPHGAAGAAQPPTCARWVSVSSVL